MPGLSQTTSIGGRGAARTCPVSEALGRDGQILAWFMSCQSVQRAFPNTRIVDAGSGFSDGRWASSIIIRRFFNQEQKQ